MRSNTIKFVKDQDFDLKLARNQSEGLDLKVLSKILNKALGLSPVTRASTPGPSPDPWASFPGA